MFFAPALSNKAVTAPDRSASDFGLQRFMRDTLGLASLPYEMEEDDRSWTLRMDVPGVPRDQLRVQIQGSTIQVDTDKDAKRQVSASFDLPAAIDPEQTEAHLQDGVLTLKVAKAESAVARRIEVK